MAWLPGNNCRMSALPTPANGAGWCRACKPELIDAGFRQKSEERLILGEGGLLGQQHQGPQGSKQVVRGRERSASPTTAANSDPTVAAAAALVADGYCRLFLSGLFISSAVRCSRWPAAKRWMAGCATGLSRCAALDWGSPPRIVSCCGWIAPTAACARCVSAWKGWRRRRAIAEVDFVGHREIDGVLWPVRFIERLKKPIPDLPVHDWQLVGLDLNRGLSASEIWHWVSGKAAAPAQPFALTSERGLSPLRPQIDHQLALRVVRLAARRAAALMTPGCSSPNPADCRPDGA